MNLRTNGSSTITAASYAQLLEEKEKREREELKNLEMDPCTCDVYMFPM